MHCSQGWIPLFNVMDFPLQSTIHLLIKRGEDRNNRYKADIKRQRKKKNRKNCGLICVFQILKNFDNFLYN